MSEGIYIYGDISKYTLNPSNVTAQKIKDSLYELTDAKKVRIYINSFGGSVFEGFGIINVFDHFKKDTGATIEIYIDGIAAGVASAIAMAGDKIYMVQDACFMLRNSYLLAFDESKIDGQRKILKNFDDVLVATYMRRFNSSEEELHQLMKNETWLNAKEAIKYGFIDEII